MAAQKRQLCSACSIRIILTRKMEEFPVFRKFLIADCVLRPRVGIIHILSDLTKGTAADGSVRHDIIATGLRPTLISFSSLIVDWNDIIDDDDDDDSAGTGCEWPPRMLRNTNEDPPRSLHRWTAPRRTHSRRWTRSRWSPRTQRSQPPELQIHMKSSHWNKRIFIVVSHAKLGCLFHSNQSKNKKLLTPYVCLLPLLREHTVWAQYVLLSFSWTCPPEI